MFATYCRLNLHVNASDMAVIRAARKKLKRGRTRRQRQFREMRHNFYRSMLKQHHDAQKLFRDMRF